HLDNIRLQRLVIADYFQPDVILNKFREVAADESPHQPHQIRNLVFRPLPVLRRERIERQTLQTERPEPTHEAAHRLYPFAMTHRAGEEALLGPAAIAVHDNGHVPCAVTSIDG